MITLREDTVRQYFEGAIDPRALDDAAARSVERHPSGSGTIARHHIEEMANDYMVSMAHLVQLIDDVLTGYISMPGLDAVVFCIEASERFTWSEDLPESERIPRALFWLGSPEVNYPLTPSTLAAIRRYLETGQELVESSGA